MLSGRCGTGAGEDACLQALRALAAKGANARCCECGQRGPTYVDVTVGTFVCSRCSGLLRGLTPPHRVKSISMATFTNEEIDFLKNKGNERCNSLWMALSEKEKPVPKDEQGLKDFLSDKYEKKRYYMDSGILPEKTKINKEPLPSPPPLPLTTKTDNVWTNIVARSVPKNAIVNKTPLLLNTRPNPVRPIPVSTIGAQNASSFPGFHADFASADIFNSSQLNNNPVMPQHHHQQQLLPPPTPSQSFFTNVDKANMNTVPQDRYAALADLDLTLRQQSQSQIKEESVKFPSNPMNPFEGNAFTPSPKNPFCTNTPNINGNTLNYSNPFIVNPSVTPAAQSKNPFL